MAFEDVRATRSPPTSRTASDAPSQPSSRYRRLRRLRHAREFAASSRAAVLAGLRDGGAHWRQPRILHDARRRGHRPTARWRGRRRLGVAQSLLRQRPEGPRRRRRQARLTRPKPRSRSALNAAAIRRPSDDFADVRDRRVGRARLRRTTCARSRPPTSRHCRSSSTAPTARPLTSPTNSSSRPARASRPSHDQPDGRNINEDARLDARRRTGRPRCSNCDADLGLAFDGDADRLIAVDAEGTVRDGDDLMVLFALDRLRARRARRRTRRHVDEQPRSAPRDRPRPASRSKRPTWATATSCSPSRSGRGCSAANSPDT